MYGRGSKLCKFTELSFKENWKLWALWKIDLNKPSS